MITVTVNDKQVRKLLASLDRHTIRAAEHALDQTAWAIYRELKATLSRVFQDPAPYTKNSLKVTKTRNHNMLATVWFKTPDRMGEHYLLPQVEGGERKEKGFERVLNHTKFIPSDHLPLDRYGNIAPGLIRQILSVLGRAELAQGYQANRTKKSAIRNPKDRDFVWLPKGAGGGKLPPGIYRRVIRGEQITAKQKRFLNRQIKAGRMAAGTYQQSRGGTSLARAKGLVPVLIVGRQHGKVTPRLLFYEIAERVYRDEFARLFHARLSSLVGGRQR